MLFIVLLTSLSLNAQKNKKKKKVDYLIYSVKDEKLISPDDIINDFKNYDVLFYGEEHNDITTHKIQALLLEKIYENYGDSTVLSMEMFERDAQYILDEYLQGLIKEKYMRKDARAWGNYNDYRPMVEFAKEKQFPVIAANAPFRYVNMVSSKGVDKLNEISEKGREAIAPLPYNIADGEYKKKLENLGKTDMNKNKKAKKSKKSKKMPVHITQDTTNTKKRKYDVIPGHSLWDATMAYSIYEHKKTHPEAKILHLNGKFHTEEFFGIVQRLKEFDENIKCLVITSISDENNFPHIDFKKYAKYGDYIIFTNPKNKKSY